MLPPTTKHVSHYGKQRCLPYTKFRYANIPDRCVWSCLNLIKQQ